VYAGQLEHVAIVISEEVCGAAIRFYTEVLGMHLLKGPAGSRNAYLAGASGSALDLLRKPAASPVRAQSQVPSWSRRPAGMSSYPR